MFPNRTTKWIVYFYTHRTPPEITSKFINTFSSYTANRRTQNAA